MFTLKKISFLTCELLLTYSKGEELAELLEASKKTIPVSCQEYADNGATRNGSYIVQPSKNISRKYFEP